MPICLHCGTNTQKETARFCAACGKSFSEPVPSKEPEQITQQSLSNCPHCEAVVQNPKACFCPVCGKSLTASVQKDCVAAETETECDQEQLAKTKSKQDEMQSEEVQEVDEQDNTFIEVPQEEAPIQRADAGPEQKEAPETETGATQLLEEAKPNQTNPKSDEVETEVETETKPEPVAVQFDSIEIPRGALPVKAGKQKTPSTNKRFAIAKWLPTFACLLILVAILILQRKTLFPASVPAEDSLNTSSSDAIQAVGSAASQPFSAGEIKGDASSAAASSAGNEGVASAAQPVQQAPPPSDGALSAQQVADYLKAYQDSYITCVNEQDPSLLQYSSVGNAARVGQRITNKANSKIIYTQHALEVDTQTLVYPAADTVMVNACCTFSVINRKGEQDPTNGITYYTFELKQIDGAWLVNRISYPSEDEYSAKQMIPFED